MFWGFDFDTTMLRVSSMNMMLHGVNGANIRYQDSLSKSIKEHYPRQEQNFFDVVLANPPFKGSLDESNTNPDVLGLVKTKKTELLFVAHILRSLKLGGRAAVVGERVAVPLLDVVDDAVRTAKGVTPTAQIAVAVGELAVLGTREGLEHVVQNLIDNAVKYGGGTPVTVRATKTAGKVTITIADAGPGIPAGSEDRIFERFYRVDAGRSREQGGTGLGLAIVKSHVEAMGGRVWFEHAKPGARFVIELDAA